MIDETIDTRRKILEAAIHVFAQKGYHDTRIDDIVAESNTSKGSVYFYFPSKQDIFLGLIDTFSGLLERRLNDVLQKDAHGIIQIDNALQETLSLFSQYRTLAKIVLVQAVGLGIAFEERRRSINDRITLIVQERLERAILDGSIFPIQTDLTARAWVGALNEIVINWIYTGKPEIAETIPFLHTILLRSIGIPDKRIETKI